MEKQAVLFHSLEGEKIIKALRIEDVQEIHHYASDQEVSRFIGWNLMSTLEETRQFIEIMLKRESAGTHLYSSIVEKLTQAIIGTAIIFNFDQTDKKKRFVDDNFNKIYSLLIQLKGAIL